MQRPISKFSQKADLPVYKAEDTIVQGLTNNDCLIFMGDTGCGKTTQIPQIIYRHRLNNKLAIAITQPRRISAMSIAKRVAEEMNSELGQLVGYNVRFNKKVNRNTKINFLTDGMLLKESTNDHVFRKYSVIILDEVHERTMNTDILLGLLKSAQSARNDNKTLPKLKIVIMSATMDTRKYKRFFNNCKEISIDGRSFECRVFRIPKKIDDYFTSCIQTVFQVNREQPIDYGILVFLTGQEEIERAAKIIRNLMKEYPKTVTPMVVYTMYAAQTDEEQTKIFKKLQNKRKVVIATNIAETSLTIPGIRVVIDCGKAKFRTYEHSTGFEVLKVGDASKYQTIQREGRACREADGLCYQMYTDESAYSMKDSVEPDILRSNLSQVLFYLIQMNIDPRQFDFFEKPDELLILKGLKELRFLSAIKGDTTLEITPFGKQFSIFPLDPKNSCMLLTAIGMKCSDEIVSIIALLSSKSIFVHPENQSPNLHTSRKKFVVPNSDHMTYLNAFQAFLNVDESMRKTWCYNHFLSYRNLCEVLEIRNQLIDVLKSNNYSIDSCNDSATIRKCLLSGFFTNTAELTNDGYITMQGGSKEVYIYGSSFFSRRAKYILFTDVIVTNRRYVNHVSEIEFGWLDEIKNIRSTCLI